MQTPGQPAKRENPSSQSRIKNQSIGMLAIAVILTLWTYQFEHHGLWGKLVNYNKTPAIVLKGTTLSQGLLTVNMYRPDGPDTYGSFVVQIAVKGEDASRPAEVWGPRQLSRLDPAAIHNRYFFQKISTGPWGLVVPLSAEASVRLPLSRTAEKGLKGQHDATVTVEDVSGLTWRTTIAVSPR